MIVEELELGVLWDEYGLIGDIVVRIFVSFRFIFVFVFLYAFEFGVIEIQVNVEIIWTRGQKVVIDFSSGSTKINT